MAEIVGLVASVVALSETVTRAIRVARKLGGALDEMQLLQVSIAKDVVMIFDCNLL